MKLFYMITAVLIALLGIAHSAMTMVFYKSLLAPDALWFFGTGLALAFNGLLNLANTSQPNRLLSIFCHISNLVLLLYVGLLIYTLPQPQAFAAGLLVFLETAAAFLYAGKSTSPA